METVRQLRRSPVVPYRSNLYRWLGRQHPEERLFAALVVLGVLALAGGAFAAGGLIPGSRRVAAPVTVRPSSPRAGQARTPTSPRPDVHPSPSPESASASTSTVAPASGAPIVVTPPTSAIRFRAQRSGAPSASAPTAPAGTLPAASAITGPPTTSTEPAAPPATRPEPTTTSTPTGNGDHWGDHWGDHSGDRWGGHGGGHWGGSRSE